MPVSAQSTASASRRSRRCSRPSWTRTRRGRRCRPRSSSSPPAAPSGVSVGRGVFVSWAGRRCQLGGACLSVGRGAFVSWAGRCWAGLPCTHSLCMVDTRAGGGEIMGWITARTASSLRLSRALLTCRVRRGEQAAALLRTEAELRAKHHGLVEAYHHHSHHNRRTHRTQSAALTGIGLCFAHGHHLRAMIITRRALGRLRFTYVIVRCRRGY
jgi:hypothetical protein